MVGGERQAKHMFSWKEFSDASGTHVNPSGFTGYPLLKHIRTRGNIVTLAAHPMTLLELNLETGKLTRLLERDLFGFEKTGETMISAAETTFYVSRPGRLLMMDLTAEPLVGPQLMESETAVLESNYPEAMGYVSENSRWLIMPIPPESSGNSEAADRPKQADDVQSGFRIFGLKEPRKNFSPAPEKEFSERLLHFGDYVYYFHKHSIKAWKLIVEE